ncbi:MAG TPA: DUF5134 domain-containing protein [Pseudonocardiaceae bacterium]|nr:DUF5134 domain-containing protein [Pseudonocardiaceae bacterium]
MVGTAWVSVAAALVFAALTLFYLARLVICARSVDASRAVMSLGMAAMLVPSLDPLPRLCWQVIFGLAAGHILVLLTGRGAGGVSPDGHRETHLVIGGLAMMYMLAVMPAAHEEAPGHAMGPTGLAVPLLSWAFVVYFLVFAVRLCARLAVPVTGGGAMPGQAVIASPHLLGSSEIVMGIGMSCMLITTLTL